MPDLVTSPLPTHLRARILFVEIKPGVIQLDCTATTCSRPDADVSAGMPFSIEADLPWSKWALAASVTFHQWAAKGREIDLEFRQHDNRPQVRASRGSTWTLLDLRPSPSNSLMANA